MHSKRVAVIFACTLVCACGPKEDEKPEDAPSGERTKEPVPQTSREAPTGPFAKYDFAAAKQAWQGAWVLEGEVIGSKVAWFIEGDKLREFNGEGERELQFTVYSPCQVSTTDAAEGITTYTNFLITGDTMHAGLGSSGTVVGDTTIVCASAKTYVLTGDKCEAWSEVFDDWKAEPATCKIEGEGADRKFTADGQSISFIDATSLATDQLKANVAQKFPNYEAAKAALAPAPTPAPTPAPPAAPTPESPK